ENIELGRTMLLDTPEPTLRYGGLLASTATLHTAVKAPVYALHGTEDRVLKAPPVKHCTLVQNAGHGMVVSHAQEVAEFLCKTVEYLQNRCNPE
ncbi:MAG: hypothetical protein LC645_05580, partial [Geobacteraceae bacterium]|nr:hypothetical protein [Geobacteraceae bacterium]